MIDFFQYISDTNNAKTADEIFALFETNLAELGFDKVLYSLMTDHNSCGLKAGHGVMRNYPEDWMKFYIEKKYEVIDPVRKHVMVNSDPFVWDQMHSRMPLIQEQKKLLNESRGAGLNCGVGLGIHCGNNEIVGLGFASTEKDISLNQNTLSMIKALANQFHFAHTELQKKLNKNIVKSPVNINLTRKEQEVLKWCANGKSKGVIASILGISENTVDYHVRSIYRKLNVSDRSLAIVKAIKYGLIQL